MPAPLWPGCVALGTSFYLQGLQCPHLQRGLATVCAQNGGWALKWGAYREQLACREHGQEGRACHSCLRKASRGALLAAHQPPPEYVLRHGREGTWGSERPR